LTDEIDSRYYEKPYYLVPNGDEADEGYAVIRDALKQTRKVAISWASEEAVKRRPGKLITLRQKARVIKQSR
jgi:non-homologous end joining protein Ku